MLRFCTTPPWKPYAIRACQGIHSIQGLNAISLYLSFFFFKNKNKNRVRPWIPCLVSIHARGIRAARPFLYRGEVVGRVATLSRFYTCSFFPLRNAYSFYFYKILGHMCTEMCISSYMKRLNPTTNQPFKRGDVREDGYVFFNYTTKVKSDGFFMERWLSADASEKAKQKDKDKKREKYERKTDRKSPGFRSLTAAQMRTVHQLQRINSEGDWTDDEIVGELIGYEIDSGPLLDEAIYHSGKLYFNAKELFRRALEF